MAAPMEVSLPQTLLQKLLDLLKLESIKFCLKIYVHVIRHIRCQVNIDYHNQHESAALIPPRCCHLWRVTQRGVQGYLSSLQQRVGLFRHCCFLYDSDSEDQDNSKNNTIIKMNNTKNSTVYEEDHDNMKDVMSQYLPAENGKFSG